MEESLSFMWEGDDAPVISVGPVLGRGAFGVVRLAALHRSVKTQHIFERLDIHVDAMAVAVKEVPLTSWDGICREVTAMVRCSGHPNIVKLLGIQRVPPDLLSPLHRCRLVMEFAPGKSLAYVGKEWLGITAANKDNADNTYGIPELIVRKYTRDLLEALIYIHELGVAHCDVKGANVLIAQDGRAVLSDFGSAFLNFTHDSEQSLLNLLREGDLETPLAGPTIGMAGGDILSRVKARERGTLRWTAPELITGASSQFATSMPSLHELQNADVWALACTVVEMLTGGVPWWSITQDSGEIMMHLISTDMRIQLPDWLSDDAKSFLHVCLNPLPAFRAAASELLDHPFVKRLPSSIQPLANLAPQLASPAPTGLSMLQNVEVRLQETYFMARIACKKGKQLLSLLARRPVTCKALYLMTGDCGHDKAKAVSLLAEWDRWAVSATEKSASALSAELYCRITGILRASPRLDLPPHAAEYYSAVFDPYSEGRPTKDGLHSISKSHMGLLLLKCVAQAAAIEEGAIADLELASLVAKNRIMDWASPSQLAGDDTDAPSWREASTIGLLLLRAWHRRASDKLLTSCIQDHVLLPSDIQAVTALYTAMHIWCTELEVVLAVTKQCARVGIYLDEGCMQRLKNRCNWLLTTGCTLANAAAAVDTSEFHTAEAAAEWACTSEAVQDFKPVAMSSVAVPWKSAALSQQLSLYTTSCGFVPDMSNLAQGCIALAPGDIVRADTGDSNGWMFVQKLGAQHLLFNDTSGERPMTARSHEIAEGWVPSGFLECLWTGVNSSPEPSHDDTADTA